MHLQAVRQKSQALKGMIPQGFMLDFALLFLYVSQYLFCILLFLDIAYTAVFVARAQT